MNTCYRFIALLCLCLAGADWPQWRGPQRDGISAETGLLAKWPEDGPKLLWQVSDAGGGYSTPAVVGQRLYLLGNEGMDNEFVQARAVAGGEQLWSVKLGKVGPNQKPPYPGSRSTPTVDGSLLFALGSDGDLACLEASSGKEHWRLNLRDQFAGKPGNWAYAESPLIDGDVLVCTPGGAEATLVALSKTSGEVIWKCAVPGGDEAAYASAIVVEAAGIKQYVQFLQNGLVGVEAETGKFLWRYDATAKGSPANIPTPVAQGGYVFSGSGRSGGGLVKVSADGGGLVAEQVYFHGKLPTSIGGAVMLDGYLYGTNSQGLLCVEFTTGELKWQDRSVGPGAVCYADGSLYLHGEGGDVALIEATPDGYRERGRFTPPDQPDRGRSKAWAYPVVAGGKLYLRDMNKLWCYSVAAGK
ncbi:MAG TPA: PQQ-binding-like beta-propeller repeat protein [Pirellulales bacterium]|nr:PQQ-binding-like beta-propeller repeat protein [Pirellulales bacterium]